MAIASMFKGFNNPVEDKSLILITKEIKEGKYKDDVLKVTALASQGNKEDADKLKKSLPAFTPSGTFEGGRKLEYLRQYSKFIILDLDNLAPDDLEAAFTKAASIPCTFSCFRSPSGKGLKILIEVNSSHEYHDQAYKQVADYYEQQIGISIDRSGKDITRLCFVSYDPQAYRNIYNQVFQVAINDPFQTPKTQVPCSPSIEETPDSDNKYDLAFEMQIAFTNQKSQYGPCNRNNYVYLLASNCNRAGIPEQDTLHLCTQRFDLAESEIRKSVDSAYKHHTLEFAKFANFAKLQTTVQPEIDTEDFLKNTPAIPEELYFQMPDILKTGASVFTDPRERDVFLTGALAILSGCLPKVKGIYAQQVVYPCLFTFAIAPAASGKGALKFAKQLGDEYHTHILTISREAEKQFQQEEFAYNQKVRMCKKGETISDEPPVKPPFKVVFIPANTSYAKILWHMEHNEGSGIICETEADTIGNVFKQEWGSYSDMLRKSFHHERLSSSRKTNNEFTEINTPALSIALSGTPSQVTGLIASAEDGLFSRFLFYAFKVEQDWKDVSPFASSVNLTDHFNHLTKEVLRMVKFLETTETEITLSNPQWALLNQNCKAWLKEVTTFTSEDAASIVKRLGLIMYRISMLFTAMRKFENADMSPKVECYDNDFSIAMQLSGIYLQHSILMFNNLPRQQNTVTFQSGDYKRKFFDALPPNFTRADAVKSGSNFSLSPRSVDEILKNATPGLLTKLKTGHYQKI